MNNRKLMQGLIIAVLPIVSAGPVLRSAPATIRNDSMPGLHPAPARLAPARPFPQHTTYHEGSILPDLISRRSMDDSVRSFYRQWKQRYVRKGCRDGESYVWFEGGAGQSVSEGQGYGMVIVALMAGYDSLARTTYDDLFRYYRSHPCGTNPHLMAWMQKKDCRSTDNSSAADGDIDIAWSLLLADAQWGSGGDVPYREDALEIIKAIREQEINSLCYSVLLSNDVDRDSKDYFDTRSSDFMPDHFRAFREASGDAAWDSVTDNGYRLFRYLQDVYSPAAGLVPDFIKNIHIAPAGPNQVAARPGALPSSPDNGISATPAQPHYLESSRDGAYNFNACRVPWHIAADYLLYGDARAAVFLEKINRWVRSTTEENPDNISAGYTLAGEDMRRRNYEALCFIAPFAVAAMTSRENQSWLNKLWSYLVNFRLQDFDYYDNSIKMLDMIILSGNYWGSVPSS